MGRGDPFCAFLGVIASWDSLGVFSQVWCYCMGLEQSFSPCFFPVVHCSSGLFCGSYAFLEYWKIWFIHKYKKLKLVISVVADSSVFLFII